MTLLFFHPLSQVFDNVIDGSAGANKFGKHRFVFGAVPVIQ